VTNDRMMVRLEAVAIELACWAADRIARTPASGVTTKTHHADPVTALDREIETAVRARIIAEFAGHRLRGEEFGDTGPATAEYTWYCDPIDGTTNYANGISWCSFSVTCFDRQGPLVGVVSDPFRRELYVGRRGDGSEVRVLDDERRPVPGQVLPLAAHPGTTLAGTVVTTEWSTHQPWPGMGQTIATLAARGCTVRVMGSSALSLIQAAAGRAAGCIIGTYSPMDGSAAALIAHEAGMIVFDDQGRRTLHPDGGGILIAAPGVAEQLLSAWQAGLTAAAGHGNGLAHCTDGISTSR